MIKFQVGEKSRVEIDGVDAYITISYTDLEQLVLNAAQNE